MLLQNALGDALNNAEWAFPLAECIHIGGMAIGVGSIALVDFRLLYFGPAGREAGSDSAIHRTNDLVVRQR